MFLPDKNSDYYKTTLTSATVCCWAAESNRSSLYSLDSLISDYRMYFARIRVSKQRIRNNKPDVSKFCFFVFAEISAVSTVF